MSNEHTPSVEDVRADWLWAQRQLGATGNDKYNEQFDRAITKIKADAVRDFLDYFETWEMVPERTERYIARLGEQA